jgi:hypothetical protein
MQPSHLYFLWKFTVVMRRECITQSAVRKQLRSLRTRIRTRSTSKKRPTTPTTIRPVTFQTSNFALQTSQLSKIRNTSATPLKNLSKLYSHSSAKTPITIRPVTFQTTTRLAREGSTQYQPAARAQADHSLARERVDASGGGEGYPKYQPAAQAKGNHSPVFGRVDASSGGEGVRSFIFWPNHHRILW